MNYLIRDWLLLAAVILLMHIFTIVISFEGVVTAVLACIYINTLK